MTAKNLLLTATFLSSILLAMTGTAIAQDADQGPATQTTDNTNQVPDESATTAVEHGKTTSDDPEATNDTAGGGDSSVLGDADDADAKETPTPTTITGMSVTRITHDCFWWNSVTYIDGYTNQQKTVEILIGPNTECAPPQPTFAPGVDWMRAGANGTTLIHYTNGTIELKDKDGKLIGVIPPAVSVPPVHDESKQVHEESKEKDRPAANNDHSQKIGTSDAPRQAKVEQSKTETRTAKVERKNVGTQRMANVGHSMAAPSQMGNVGHLVMGGVQMAMLGHGMGMMSGLGHGGGMHMGGMRMGGMHMGGMHMGKR